MGGTLRNISGQTQYLEFKDSEGKIVREEVVLPFAEINVTEAEVAQIKGKLAGVQPSFILFA